MSGADGVMVYSLFDRKLREYGPLAVVKNDESVKRSLLDSIVGSGSLQEKHANDYDVMQVGWFFADTGYLTGMPDIPRFVVNLGELIGVAPSGVKVAEVVN